MPKTVVFCHALSRHVDFKGHDWDYLELGSLEWGLSLYGRIPMSLKTAFDEGADVLYLSGFIGDKGWELDASGLVRFVEANRAVLLESIGVPDRELPFALRSYNALNTTEECEFMFNGLADKFDRLFMVTNSWHTPRLMREATKAAQKARETGLFVPSFYAVATHGGDEGVTIFEPPAHAAPWQSQMHEIAARYFNIAPRLRQSFEYDLKSLIGNYISHSG